MMEVSEARELLNNIPCSQLDYQDWVNVGMALHHEGMPCSIWDEWSSTDKKRYHVGECAKRWGSFGEKDNVVTMGTVVHMAKSYGWNPAHSMKTCDWDDLIITDNETDSRWNNSNTNQGLPSVQDDYSPISDITKYLSALFEPEDKVCITTKATKDEDGKWHPVGGSDSRTCKQLLNSLAKNNEYSISDTFGTINNDSGVWICFNPTGGQGRKNNNVTAFRYALVESDTISIDEQWKKINDLRLPVAVVVNSGGKSLHAIIHIDAKDAREYSERVQILYDYCEKHDYPVDRANKNPARLSRLPGVKRGDKWQYIVGQNIGPGSWLEWERTILNPIPVYVIDGHWENLPPLKPELIHGILRQMHKLIFVSGSKAGKSFSLIHLAICIAEGQPWMGHECEQGEVLYINLEIDEASFLHRIEKVYTALGFTPSGTFTPITLRGRNVNIDTLLDVILHYIPHKKWKAIFIDPFYKLGVTDENDASAVARFCCTLDTISEKTGAAIIYCHHHSKGVQSGKNSMDRASGSGVFARDADAIIDLLELSFPQEYENSIKEKYGNDCIPCEMDFTLREFRRIDPVNCIFSYPLLYEDTDGWLDNARTADIERALSYGRKKGSETNRVKSENNISNLKSLIRKDLHDKIVKSKSQYAEEMNVTITAIGRWIKKDPELETLFDMVKQNKS